MKKEDTNKNALSYYNTLMFALMSRCNPEEFTVDNCKSIINVSLSVPENMAEVFKKVYMTAQAGDEKVMSNLLDATASGIFLEGIHYCVRRWIDENLDEFLNDMKGITKC